MPADIEEKNAIITAATITSGDYGLLSAWLTLDYGNSGRQGFGGYSLYLPKSFKHHTINGPAGHFIWRVMEIAGVEKWDALVGKTIRVRASHSGVQAIGHIVKDDWFVPSVDLAAAWCEDFTPLDVGPEHPSKIALSCVRAMQALASHTVRFEPARFDGDVWGARDARGDWHYHTDPLTAITLALTEAGDA